MSTHALLNTHSLTFTSGRRRSVSAPLVVDEALCPHALLNNDSLNNHSLIFTIGRRRSVSAPLVVDEALCPHALLNNHSLNNHSLIFTIGRRRSVSAPLVVDEAELPEVLRGALKAARERMAEKRARRARGEAPDNDENDDEDDDPVRMQRIAHHLLSTPQHSMAGSLHAFNCLHNDGNHLLSRACFFFQPILL